MQEGSMGFSVNDMMNFLDFAGERGLINKSTAVARKKASSSILGILDKTEASDLTKIDLKDVIERHSTLAANKITPATLLTYQSRTRKALDDFLNYSKNPSKWRPAGKKRVIKADKKPTTATKPKAGSHGNTPPETEGPKLPPQPSVHIDVQVHISPNSTPEQIDKIFDSMRRHLYGTGK